jgi:hypothetical protein
MHMPHKLVFAAFRPPDREHAGNEQRRAHLETNDEVGYPVLRVWQLAEGHEGGNQQVGYDEEPQAKGAEQDTTGDSSERRPWAIDCTSKAIEAISCKKEQQVSGTDSMKWASVPATEVGEEGMCLRGHECALPAGGP